MGLNPVQENHGLPSRTVHSKEPALVGRALGLTPTESCYRRVAEPTCWLVPGGSGGATWREPAAASHSASLTCAL